MLKFENGNVYRHVNTLDIDFVVVSDVLYTPEHIGFKTLYWNKHYRIFQGSAEFVKIDIKDLGKWSKIC